jgi:hypothetical protein
MSVFELREFAGSGFVSSRVAEELLLGEGIAVGPVRADADSESARARTALSLRLPDGVEMHLLHTRQIRSALAEMLQCRGAPNTGCSCSRSRRP